MAKLESSPLVVLFFHFASLTAWSRRKLSRFRELSTQIGDLVSFVFGVIVDLGKEETHVQIATKVEDYTMHPLAVDAVVVVGGEDYICVLLLLPL
mmetsp:Transcript_8653/g.15685  ORF Transcript_8653/g.15685 Transcript_8653/m.15685 type:complete len:95 (+) Transcript_8653:367-651(+)